MHTTPFGSWMNTEENTPMGNGNTSHEARMEPRITKLEVATDFLQRDLGGLREGVGGTMAVLTATRERLVTIETRLGHMPTKLEMWTGVGAVLLAVGGAVWWLVQQYLGPILVRAVGG